MVLQKSTDLRDGQENNFVNHTLGYLPLPRNPPPRKTRPETEAQAPALPYSLLLLACCKTSSVNSLCTPVVATDPWKAACATSLIKPRLLDVLFQ